MPHESPDERRSARSRVLLAATVEGSGDPIRVRIEDLSAHGARVLGENLPPVDTPVTFQCNDLRVSGYVAWVQPGSAGIGFGHAVRPDDALRPVSKPRKVPIPAPSRDFRRPGFRPQQLTEAEQRAIAEWSSRNRLGD